MNTYSIRVLTTDQSGHALDKQFTIAVTNVNEAPTIVVLSPTNISLAEDVSTAGFIDLATLSIMDDALGTNALTLSGTDADSFEIVGDQLRLKAGVALDFETQSSYSVTVDLEDATVGSTPDASASFTLNISDVNEAPPTVTLSINNSSIAEGAGIAVFAATLSAKSGQVVTVNFDATGTATFGTDFSGVVNSIEIPAGQITGTFTVTATQDLLAEANETVIIDISTVTNGTENGTQSQTTTIIDDDNSIPVVGSIGNAVTYTDNAARVLVFPIAAVTDDDTTLFTNGKLTVTNTNGQPTDSLAIVPTTVVTVSVANVLYNNVVIGSFTGGAGTTPLAFTFNNQTNTARMKLALNAIGFSSSSENLTTTSRTVSVVVNDGVGGDSVSQSKQVNVIAVNDVPVSR